MATSSKKMKPVKKTAAKSKAAPKKAAQEEMNLPVEHQSPLESFSEHMPHAGVAAKDMTPAQQRAQVRAQKELTKQSKKTSTEKNHDLSHIRSSSASMIRGH